MRFFALQRLLRGIRVSGFGIRRGVSGFGIRNSGFALGCRILFTFTFLFTFASFAAGATHARYTLSETRTQTVSGPFTLFDGARIRLGGELYRVNIGSDRRITFTSPAGTPFGPYQMVPGRIMQIGKAMYSFDWAGASSRDGRTASSSHDGRTGFGQRGSGAAEAPASAPIATFAPMPPKPELIEIPPEVEHRSVPSLDLPALPDASRPLAWNFWLAPIDRTPFKWRVESVSGRDVDFERTSAGAGLSLNSWMAEAAYSTSGKSGAIVPEGLGFSGSSIEDASGFALALGYKRPFLVEGGWTASAGIMGRIRQEKGDISSSALVATGEADTNDVGNVISEYQTRSSSIKISEKTLRLDFELGYRIESFRIFGDLVLQPLSSVSVSGKLPYGDDNLKISAKHDDAVGVMFGGSFDLPADFKIFADCTILCETRLRLGLSRAF